MGKPGKVPPKENLTSPWAFEICQNICTRRDVKEHVFKYRRAPPQLLLLSMGMLCNTKMNTFQKLQNRAARIVMGSPFDSLAAPLLQRLGWLSVDRLVHKETSTMVYKPLNGLAPDNLCQIFSQLFDVHNQLLRNTKCDLVIPQMRTAYGQNSFAFRGVDTWSKLHSDIKLAPSIQSFKAKLKAHN